MSILKNINIKNISLMLCYLIISAYIVLGNCLTFNLGNRMPIKVAEIIAFISCVILFIFHKKDLLKISKSNIKLLIWFAIAIVPIIFLDYTLNQKIYGLLYSARIVATLFVALAINNIFKKYDICINRFLNYIIYNYIIVVIIGIIQVVLFPQAHDFYRIFYKIGVYFSNPDAHLERLVSTYFDPNFLAACLIIPTILSLHNYVNTGKKIYIFYIALFITIIILTVSRSGILGICVALFVYTVCTIKFDKKKIKIDKQTIRACFITVTTAVIFIFFMFCTNVRVFKRILNTAEDESTHARIEDWVGGINSFISKEEVTEKNESGKQEIYNENQNTAVEENKNQNTVVEENKNENQNQNTIIVRDNKKTFKNNILFGIGYNMLGFMESNVDKPSAASFGNDSSLIVIFITSGIVGLIYFIGLVGTWLIRKYGNRMKNTVDIALIAIILSALIICNFNNLLFYTLWLMPIFVLLNMGNTEN